MLYLLYLIGNMSKGVENMSEKILIIDDEQDIADLLEVYLKNENYVVYKFYCATDAMSCIESGDIDLAILDIMLPDMNGFSLCQLIRKKYCLTMQANRSTELLRYCGCFHVMSGCSFYLLFLFRYSSQAFSIPLSCSQFSLFIASS